MRRFRNGQTNACMHAEMNVLRFARPGDVLEVMRFGKRGNITMAKPCEHCQQLINSLDLKEVRYTDWEGNWQTLETRRS